MKCVPPFPLILPLLAVLLPPLAGWAAPAPVTHGIIQFYEPKPGDNPPTDLNDPLVAGAEAIFWWGDLEPREGAYEWTRVDRELQLWQGAGKQLDIRLGTAHIGPNHSPAWLYDHYHVRRIGRGHWCDAEAGLGIYSLGPRGRLTGRAGEVITGHASIASADSDRDAEPVLLMQQTRVFAPESLYSLQFDYFSTTGATGWVALASATTGFTNRGEFIARAGERGSYSFPFTTPAAPDAQLLWGLTGPGRLSLDNLNLLPVVNQPPLRFDGAEAGLRDWVLTDIGKVTRDRRLVLAGRAAVLLSNQAPGYVAGLLNHPQHFPILRGQGYSATFQFKALTDATVRLRLISHAPPYDLLDEQVITLKTGDSGQQPWHYPAFVWRDETRLEIGLNGPGQVVIDDLRWSRWSDRVTCFPDYFSPVFREKWDRFVTAFAQRYAGHPGLGRISVGGFGRWEEVILDDDVPGLLDAQWLARGFTTEKYLAHVSWCMDLFQRLLPNQPLRICLAYGLKRQNDQDLVYRRVAQAAVARGIGLKQNGLSEKYGAWDDITSAPYLFNRYRFHPGISLTYETGGQISRVSPHYAQGHPLSVLNRALIDGAHFLFLYSTDIHSRHVHKYLPYTADTLGAPLFTTFYSRLGDFSLVMEHSPSPQEYRNQWLGLREYSTAGAAPALTSVSGQPCAATRPGAPHLVFDVDDRQQYHGMHGVVCSIEYLDDTTDEFEVNGFNQWTRAWEKLGHVRKTGSGSWKRASFLKPDWCRSSRGDGEDVHADLVVNDLGDGIEHIAGVELAFVPAREWRRDLIQAREPAANHAALTSALTREFVIPSSTVLHWVAVPLWSRGWERNGLRGRVVALADSAEVVASEKDYPLPADGDWFELPLTPVPNCRRFRLELFNPVGQVGVYLDHEDRLAYRAWQYAVTPVRPVEWAVSSASGAAREIGFAAAAPFAGLRLQIPSQAVRGFSAQVHRRLAQDEWSPPITRQPCAANHRDGLLALWFEPQTAGDYKLVLAPLQAETAAPAGLEGASLEVLELQRRQPPHPSTLEHSPPGRLLFEPNAPKTSPLKLQALALRHTVSHTLTLEIQGAPAALEFAPTQPVTARAGDRLRFQLANRSGVPLCRVFWAAPGQSFTRARSALLPLVQHDAVLREYDFALGHDDTWRGPVERLRFEWLAGPSRGSIQLGPIRLHELTVPEP